MNTAVQKKIDDGKTRQALLGSKPVETKIKNAATVGWFQQCVHRSRNEIFSETKTITPAMAEVILSNNPDNRRIRPAKFTQMVTDMTMGRWSFNGEPIIIAKTGELNDGQHRLEALVQAKASLPMLFVFGVDRETRNTVDQGAPRGAGDYLQMGGVTNATTAATVARYLISYENAKGSGLGDWSRVTPAQVVERATTDITIATSASYAIRYNARMHKYLGGSIVAFCHNVLLGISATDGLAFMEMLCTGENLQRRDPAFKAREKLLAMEGKGRVLSKVEIVFRAWNAYRQQRSMSTIPVHGRLPELV